MFAAPRLANFARVQLFSAAIIGMTNATVKVESTSPGGAPAIAMGGLKPGMPNKRKRVAVIGNKTAIAAALKVLAIDSRTVRAIEETISMPAFVMLDKNSRQNMMRKPWQQRGTVKHYD